MTATHDRSPFRAIGLSVLAGLVSMVLLVTGLSATGCAPKASEPGAPIHERAGQAARGESKVAAADASAEAALGDNTETASSSPDANPTAAPPRVTVHLASLEPQPGYTPAENERWGRTIYIAPEVVLSNEAFLSAEAVDDEYGPVVNITLTPEGGQKMAEFTKAHIGELVGIQVDGSLKSAAKIMSQVSAKIQICANWEKDEATRLAEALNP